MIRKILFSFVPFFAIFLGIIALGSFAVFKAGIAFGLIRPGISEKIILLKFIFLPVVLMIAMFLGTKLKNKILNIVYIISATWLAILLWLFIATVLLSLYMLIVHLFGIEAHMYPLAITACLIILFMTIYGIFHARKIQITEYEIDSPALSENWKNKKIVLVSDLHLGMVLGKNFLKKVVEKINVIKPDIIFIPGDIIDGPSFDYAKVFAYLGNLKSTYGTYFTPGNHEKFNREPNIWEPILKSHVTVLADEKTEINGTQIIGLDFKNEKMDETKIRMEKIGYEKNKPSIVLLHDPKNTPVLAQMGTSLILSGHTHLGQFWPLNLLVKAMYKKFAYGMVKTGGTISITSSGIGTAMSPIRLLTKSEIVVIKIK